MERRREVTLPLQHLFSISKTELRRTDAKTMPLRFNRGGQRNKPGIVQLI